MESSRNKSDTLKKLILLTKRKISLKATQPIGARAKSLCSLAFSLPFLNESARIKKNTAESRAKAA